MSYRDKTRCAFETKSARRAQNEYLNLIKERHSALKAFADVEELLETLRDKAGHPETKDAVLLALLEEHQQENGGGPFTLLAVAMFPVLDRIYRNRVQRAKEHDDLWGQVVGAFVEALDRYPTERRPSRVAANIEGDTMGAMRRANVRETRDALARQQLAENTRPFVAEIESVDPGSLSEQQLSWGDFIEPGQEAPIEPDQGEMREAETAVAGLFDSVQLSEQDRFLILGVQLYERTLGDLASELGISREAAKKRHLRAIRRLRSSAHHK